MEANIYSQLKKLSLGFLSLILFSCSEVSSDEVNTISDDLQVVTSSMVIRADGSAESGDIVGVKEELVIANGKTMESQYPGQSVSMSALANTLIPQIGTKSFVKTTVRKARVMANDDTDTAVTGWPLDVDAVIRSLIDDLRSRINKNCTIRITVEYWFDPIPECDYWGW